MKDTLCIDGGHSNHQFGVNLVGFHAIIFTVLHLEVIIVTQCSLTSMKNVYDDDTFHLYFNTILLNRVNHFQYAYYT